MTTLVTQDALVPSVDYDGVTVDQARGGPVQPNWPCSALPADPPSVADRQSDPTPEDLLPAVLALAPRGPAWGTDEAGDGRGASPVLRQVWTALAAWAAGNNRRDFALATQALPSAITDALPDWEQELGLPDPCYRGAAGAQARVAAVRARFAAQGGQSPAYFVCLAAAVGYDITIEEPSQFLVDVSEVGPDPIDETFFLVDDGILSGDSVAEGFFRVDESVLSNDSVVDGVLQPEGEGDRLETYALAPEGEGTRIEAFALNGRQEPLDEVADETVWKYWVVRVGSAAETWFRIDEGELARDSLVDGVLQPEGPGDPLEGFLAAQDLECVLRRYAPRHTVLVFDYSGAA